ncbi:MAG: RHS repeat-associated core domain-containing protein [Planctomycetes bacterium]|nr:RHS repeat-associated core domain-containing protein [Planctomycetota bacterium]
MPLDPSGFQPPEPDKTCPPTSVSCRETCGCVAYEGENDASSCDDPCGCEEPGEQGCQKACENECDCSGGGTSSGPIKYANGEIDLSVTELSSRGFGSFWGHTRTYSNRLSASFDFGNGFNWIVKQWAYLTEGDGGAFVFVRSPSDAVWFDPSGSDFIARYGALQTLTHDPLAGTFTVSTPDGDRWQFHDFSQTTFPPGMLKSYLTAGNQAVEVTAYTADDRIGQVERSLVVDGRTYREAFAYAYFGGEQAGRLATVTLRRRNGGAPWSDVRRVRYEYYSAGDDFGGEGDLRTAIVEAPAGFQWEPVDTRYYRYYREGDLNGMAHGLKYAFSSAAFRRLQQAAGDPLTAADSQAAAFADFYYEYNAEQRVSLERTAAGSRQFTFEYFDSSHPDAPNNWKRKTVETQPDLTQNIVYTNHLGQVLLKEFRAGASSWINYRRYGELSDAASRYRLVLKAEPSAVVSYDDAQADLGVVLKTNAGLIELSAYHDGTGGSPLGFPAGASLQEGTANAPIKLKEWEWAANTTGGLTVYHLAEETVYKSAAGGGSEPIVTAYSYTYHAGTNQVAQQTMTLPAVPVGQNGSGVSPQQRELYDLLGNMTWEQGPKGFIDNFSYDVATAARTQMIDDVDASQLAYPSGWTRPSDLPAPLHLVTDYRNDVLGRNEETLGPVHEIEGVATRQATWTVRMDAKHETRRARGYATAIGPNYDFRLVNPVSIARRNETVGVRDFIQAARREAAGPLSPADEFLPPSWTAWSQERYDDRNQLIARRVYHTLPTSGEGASHANYDETTFEYDLMGRQNRARSPGGTITQTVFDPRGLVAAVWVGTNDARATDADPSGGGAAGNNMVVVTANVYDGGSDGGDGNLTQVTLFVDGTGTNDRVTSYGYDFRGRKTTIDGEIDFYQVTTYDNLDRAVRVQRYDTSGPPAGTLVAQRETLYDDRANVYQTRTYAVNPTTGAVGNALVDNFWYDAAGNGVKELPSGSQRFIKRMFDGIGRETASYRGFYTGTGTEPYADVGKVTAQNKIFEQTLTIFDAASNPIQLSTYQRFHDATGQGPLNLPDAAQPKARVSYLAGYFDGVGRQVAAADYGTNDNFAFSRSVAIPPRSDDVLITSTGYDSAGRAFQAIDPAGVETRRQFDAVGRETAIIRNFTDGGHACGDANVTVRFTYTPDGKLATLVAVNADTGDQTTTYLYGTAVDDSAIARSDLLRAIVYPDAVDVADKVLYRYNRQGERVRLQDQNGTVHEFIYDKLARRTADRAQVLGTSIDGSVLRVETAYDVRGLVRSVTNFAAAMAGSVVNEVQRSYNDFGQLTVEYQEHSGAVNTSNTPRVQYSYADGSANTVRPTTMTYPNGRVVTFAYGTTGSDDDRLSRVASLGDAGPVQRVVYTYLGQASFVQADYPEPQVRWDLATGSGANPYAGLDRFGRTIDCLWRHYGASPADRERVQYGYDEASNRVWRIDAVAPAGGNDELYGYDRLQRLVESARGTLATDRSHVEDLQFVQDWTLDPTGNWNRMQQTNPTVELDNLDQSRWQNQANEIRKIVRRYGADWEPPEYDRAGNTTRFLQPNAPTVEYGAVYDAWNRLVRLFDGSSFNAEYAYDGFMRRVETVFSGTTRHTYYSAQWRALEVRLGNSPNSAPAERQLFWGLRYIDDLVLRDRSLANNGTLGERLYALQDANWNVVATVGTNGEVQERYRYAAYGMPTFLQANFAAKIPNQSGFAWDVLYAGYPWDEGSGLYYVRMRILNSRMGTWLTRDPERYAGGMNLYEYAASNSISLRDPFGLDVTLQNTTALPAGIHQRVCVDTWDDSCCHKSGRYCISFGVDNDGVDNPPPTNACADKYFPFDVDPTGSGIVYPDNDDPESKRPLVKLYNYVFETISQGCEADKLVLEYFESIVNTKAKYANPGDVLNPSKIQNCRKFSRAIIDHIKQDPRYDE